MDIKGITRLHAGLLATSCLLAAGEVAAAEPEDLFHITEVRPVIASGAATRLFDGSADGGRITAFMSEAVGTSAARSLKGARPLMLEVHVHRFLPVRPENSSAFGPNHKIRADYVLIDGATAIVLNKSPQVLDLFALWLQSTETIRGPDGKAPQRRLAKHIALMSEVWGRGLSCDDISCDANVGLTAAEQELTAKVERNDAIVLEPVLTETRPAAAAVNTVAPSASASSAKFAAATRRAAASSTSAPKLVLDVGDLAPLPEATSGTAFQPPVGGQAQSTFVVDLSGAILAED